MRTEQRTIVPFKGAAAADALLDLIVFEMSVEGSVARPAEEVERLHPTHLAALALKARFNFNDDAVGFLSTETGIAASNMLIVLVATGRVARRSSILAKWELSQMDSMPETLEILPSSIGMAALGDAGGFEVTALLRLRSGLKRKALQAHIAGTVLGRRSVAFRLPQDNPGLSPMALTREKREELGLPENSMTFVQCADLLDADDLTSRVSVYVDETILTELVVDNPATRQLQASLSIDVVIAMASQIHRELEDAGAVRGGFAEMADHNYSACANFLSRTCKSMQIAADSTNKENILDWARNSPALLRANLEHGWKVRDLTVRVIRGGES